MTNTVFLNDNSSQVRERLEDLAQYAVSAGLLKSREYCEKHPLRVIAGVAGACFLLGGLLCARKSRRV